MFSAAFRFSLFAIVGLSFSSHKTSLAQNKKPKALKGRVSAVEMMKRAHVTRAEWKDFAGFSADLAVFDGDTRTTGTLKVTSDGEVTVQLTDSEVAKWVQADLKSLVDHRLPSEGQEYNVSFVKGEKASALGRLIAFNDDRMHSVYRIRYNLITEVHRTMGQRKLAIKVIDVQWNKEKKTLPRTYTVSWSDAKTGKIETSQIVNNRWKRVGNWDLPVRVLKIESNSDGPQTVREIRVTNHKAL